MGYLLVIGLFGLIAAGIIFVARRVQGRVVKIILYVIAVPFVCVALGGVVNLLQGK